MYVIILVGAWVLWHIAFRIRVIGRENIPRKGGFILAGNHISAIDPVFLAISRFWGRRMVVMGKAELFGKNAFFDWFLHLTGVVAVDRGKGDTKLIEQVCRECRAGRGLLIFPEGTRSKDGKLGRLKTGAFLVAAEAGVDMIPCRIIYDTPDGKMKLFCRVRVCFGKAIPAEKFAMEGPHDLHRLREGKQLLREALEQLYEENKFR